MFASDPSSSSGLSAPCARPCSLIPHGLVSYGFPKFDFYHGRFLFILKDLLCVVYSVYCSFKYHLQSVQSMSGLTSVTLLKQYGDIFDGIALSVCLTTGLSVYAMLMHYDMHVIVQ